MQQYSSVRDRSSEAPSKLSSALACRFFLPTRFTVNSVRIQDRAVLARGSWRHLGQAATTVRGCALQIEHAAQAVQRTPHYFLRLFFCKTQVGFSHACNTALAAHAIVCAFCPDPTRRLLLHEMRLMTKALKKPWASCKQLCGGAGGALFKLSMQPKQCRGHPIIFSACFFARPKWVSAMHATQPWLLRALVFVFSRGCGRSGMSLKILRFCLLQFAMRLLHTSCVVTLSKAQEEHHN